MGLRRDFICAVVPLVFLSGACGLLSNPADGFDSYRTCAPDTGNEPCVQVQVREKANEYEVELVSESATEIRIRLVTSGSASGSDDGFPFLEVQLSQALGDRTVIDDIRDLPATKWG